MTSRRGLMEERGTRADMPMKPQVVAHEFNKLLSDNAILATDSGTITTWIARHVDIRGEMMFSCSGNLATMACGLPYANAAAVAYPGRQVICFIGDGGFARYAQRRQDRADRRLKRHSRDHLNRRSIERRARACKRRTGMRKANASGGARADVGALLERDLRL